ncbi:MAG: hypothetical protein H0T08_00170 [Acidobacteria bacterium]|nr:hypothetical protein [Acidobacteriota bacterium]
MSKKNISNKKRIKNASPERRSIPWRYRFLTLVCGLLLVVGFFFAARQHFASFDFRVKNSRLKKQIEELEADKRRLLLAKEIALSHTEIKKAAKKIGLTYAPSDKTVESRTNVAPQEKTRPEKLLVEKPKPTPAPTSAKVEEPKTEAKKPESGVKKLPELKDKENKTKPAQVAKK